MRKLDKLYTRLVAKYVMILVKLFKLETQRSSHYILVVLEVCKCLNLMILNFKYEVFFRFNWSSYLTMKVQVLVNYIEMDTGIFDCAYPFCIENVVI